MPLTDCDVCGYRPRMKDGFNVKLEDQEIIHVICYNCGHEWVE